MWVKQSRPQVPNPILDMSRETHRVYLIVCGTVGGKYAGSRSLVIYPRSALTKRGH